MIKINKSAIAEISYEIEVDGISITEISQIRLSINKDDMIYSYLGVLDDKIVMFSVNTSGMSAGTYDFSVEIFVSNYYFKVYSDKLNITETKFEVKLINSDSKIVESKNIPKVKLKL